MKIKNNTNTLP